MNDFFPSHQKHFPHAIEHTIEWGRDSFDKLFVSSAQEVNTFSDDREAYLRKLPTEASASGQVEKLNAIKKMLFTSKPAVETMVQYAVSQFQEDFEFQVGWGFSWK